MLHPRRRGAEEEGSLCPGQSWEITVCPYLGNEHKRADTSLLVKEPLSLEFELVTVTITGFSVSNEDKVKSY